MPKRLPHSKTMRRHFFQEWRTFRQLSQERAAERIGIDRSHLSRMESSKSEYNQAFLEAAAVAYSCEPADLLIRNPLDTAAMWSLLASLKSIPDEKQKAILAVVETMLKTGT